MAYIDVDIDSAELLAASRRLAEAMDRFPTLTAIAMTKGVVASRDAIRREILPMIEGGPSRWTERGLIFKRATPKDLRAQAGFQHGQGRFEDDHLARKGGGVAAGRYMRTLARGGDRPAKSSELHAWRSGLLKKNEDYLLPNEKLPEIDAHGNLPGTYWRSALAGVGGIHAPGSGQNVTRRSAWINPKTGKARRPRAGAKNKYFLMYKHSADGEGFGYASAGKGGSRFRGDERPWAIVRRTGNKNRGFVPVLFISQWQNYEGIFPIDQVALKAFRSTYAKTFTELVKEAWERRQAKLNR
jgi:hypothetical protein